ncbi:MAG TPA: hypothetical protein VGN01_04340 [Acidobacteriaceae bacterium]|jgi:hypothetical protein
MTTGDNAYVLAIRKWGKLISEPIAIGDSTLWIPDHELELLALEGLRGVDVRLPQRTRAKLVRQKICEALGYPIPKSFPRTRPRFIGQNFDSFVQLRDNLQVWNAEILPSQRYLILRASEDGAITSARVIGGAALALMDKTGTLTQKYQASVTPGEARCELVVAEDTANLKPLLSRSEVNCFLRIPTEEPVAGELCSIQALFRTLSPLVGRSFEDAGHGQERVRGGALHELVCQEMGYPTFSDNGQLPDILDQLLEVKLQLARTIDLGLVCPDSQLPLSDTALAGVQKIRHCDLRYAVFCGTSYRKRVTLTHLFLTTGEAFFSKFKRFEGKVVNRKIQIPLPKNFFDQRKTR